MTPLPISISDAAARLSASATHIIVCDTCALLDIIRLLLPNRSENVTALNATLTAVDAFRGLIDSGQATLVCPSPVPLEWFTHATRLREETIRQIEQIESEFFKSRAVAAHAGISVASVSLPAHAIAQHLYDISERLLASSIVLAKEDGPSLRATDRAAANIAPASKGAIKDCLIYEHMIELFDNLTLGRPSGKRILLTSNTDDFCNDKKRPKVPLATELAQRGIELCTRWDWAHSVIKVT